MAYHWQLPDWPNFTYRTEDIQPLITDFARETGEMNGVLLALPGNVQEEISLQLMLAEAVNTSEIEGEYLSREDVMSSIRNNLGLNETPEYVKDRRASGVARLMVDVRRSYAAPLNIAMLKEWHKDLLENAKNINTGEWRQGTAPMQVISGAPGKEIIHYEAPPSAIVPKEMERFVKWFNNVDFDINGDIAHAILKSTIAHLYFESIHPFEDGNGRIGRAIAEKALSQSLRRPVMLSLSKIIEKNRKAYYEALKKAQRSLEITDWIRYFAMVIIEAQKDAKSMVQFILKKARFFDRYKDQLNSRQLKAVNKMLDAGEEGFEGGMTARKYISITQTSKPTATRDLQHLHEIGAFTQEGAGRSVKYHLNIP
ncbi:Fic family protein [Chitinophaga sp. 22620]|uniref:Fic family protein n=1 Tax=Chitinophaga sp. 22620 TaxID=3453952 RepID=UPI003F87B608